jgi:hypothetical protein
MLTLLTVIRENVRFVPNRIGREITKKFAAPEANAPAPGFAMQ